MFKAFKGLDIKTDIETEDESKPTYRMVQHLTTKELYEKIVKEAKKQPKDSIVWLTEDVADILVKNGYITKPEIAGRKAKLVPEEDNPFI